MVRRGDMLPPRTRYSDYPDDVIMVSHEGLVVTNKPAGLSSTGRDQRDLECLQMLVRARLGRWKVWAVHQLDKDTSGLNVFVLRKALVAEWSERLKPPSGEKAYLAVCRGRWAHGERVIDHPIGRVRQGGVDRPAIDPRGREAITHVKPLGVGDDATLLEIRLQTGRTHQIRVHLAAMGHPLMGERVHRDPPCTGHHRHALHAWRISIAGGAPIGQTFQAPVPGDFRRLCARHGLLLPANERSTS